MSKLVQLGAIAAAVAALVGCSGAHYTLTDDVDLTWDFLSLPTRFDAALHAPYVLGTKVTLFARSSDDHEDLSGFTIVTSDAAVFRVDDAVLSSDRREIAVHGHAMSEGTATLTVVDARGHAVGHGAAEVLAPDRIDVSAHGSLILGREDEARVSEIRTVTSGLATYLVRYARDGRELHGNGVLMVDAPAQVAADVRTTFLFENREWLAVRSTAAAATSITLRTPGSPAVVVPIVTVPETAIADLVLLTQPERDRHDDGAEVPILLAANRRRGSHRRRLHVRPGAVRRHRPFPRGLSVHGRDDREDKSERSHGGGHRV